MLLRAVHKLVEQARLRLRSRAGIQLARHNGRQPYLPSEHGVEEGPTRLPNGRHEGRSVRDERACHARLERHGGLAGRGRLGRQRTEELFEVSESAEVVQPL